MALTDLLRAGAERVAAGVTSQLEWRQDSRGRWYRMPLTWTHRGVIQDRVASRMGRPLTTKEKQELARIVDAADNATRRAAQVQRGDPNGNRSGNVRRLPGTGNRGGSSYTYTAAVSVQGGLLGEVQKFTVVIHSASPLTIGEIEGQIAGRIASGQIEQREGSGRPILSGRRLVGVDLVSVYLGSVR